MTNGAQLFENRQVSAIIFFTRSVLVYFNFGRGRHAYFMLALLFVMSVTACYAIAIKFFMNTFTVDAWKITFHVSFK